MLILYHPILWVQLFVWILTWSMINFSTILWCQHMQKNPLDIQDYTLTLWTSLSFSSDVGGWDVM